MKKNYLFFIIILILFISTLLWWRFSGPEDTWICENGTWIKHGNPETPQPVTGCGEEANNIVNDIVIMSPTPESEVTSPLIISGQARGNWFFEATFPIQLTTVHGLILGNTQAQAQSDWMTEGYVPFIATLDFNMPNDVDQGELIFEKANPSGLPEHGAEYRLPVKFKNN